MVVLKNSRGASKPELAEVKQAKVTSLGWINFQIRSLEGKILTIIDASYSDEVQRKAVKDLTKATFRTKMDWIDEISHNQIGKKIVPGNEA